MAIKWPRQHEERRQALIASFSRDAAPRYSPAEIAAIKALPFAPKIRLLFPQFIRPNVPDAPFHPAIDAKRHAGGRIEVTCGARNTAKSTRIMICATAIDICERAFRYIVFGARTVDAAAEKADIVRLLLEHSPILKAVYGDRLGCEQGHDEEADWVANGCRLRSLGIGQSIRGALGATGDRVQCARLDDVDDMMLNRSRERQDNLWDWLRGEVYQALADPGGRSVCHVLCNMFNRTCLAARAEELARERPDLCGFERYPLLGPDGESTWPGRFSTAQVLKMMALAGPARARTEYLCLPANDESLFQPEWFVDYRIADLSPGQIASMRKVLWYDPSFTETGCYKAIVVLGRFPGDTTVYCLHAWVRKAGPDAAAREIQRVFLAWPDTEVWVEDNAGTKDTYRPWFERLAREAPVPLVHYEPATENKDVEIRRWQGEFAQGLWRFDRSEGDQQTLVNQWCDYPSKYLDGPDAGSRCRRKLGDANRTAVYEIRRGLPRADYGALTGVPSRRVALPGSLDARWDREAESAFDRMERATGGLVF